MAHTFIPVVYCLLNSRKEAVYTHVLNTLKSLRTDIKPTSISTDFEKAEINSFKKVFPEIQSRCCFFHLQQSIHRKVCELGLKQLYETDPDFRLEVNLIPSLAFIPTTKLPDAFHLLHGLVYVDEMLELLSYFERCYIGVPIGNGNIKPLGYLLNIVTNSR